MINPFVVNIALVGEPVEYAERIRPALDRFGYSLIRFNFETSFEDLLTAHRPAIVLMGDRASWAALFVKRMGLPDAESVRLQPIGAPPQLHASPPWDHLVWRDLPPDELARYLRTIVRRVESLTRLRAAREAKLAEKEKR